MAIESRTQWLSRDIAKLVHGIRQEDLSTVSHYTHKLNDEFTRDYRLYNELPEATLELLAGYLSKLFRRIFHECPFDLRVKTKPRRRSQLKPGRFLIQQICTLLVAVAHTTKSPVIDLLQQEVFDIAADLVSSSNTRYCIDVALTILRSKCRFEPKVLRDHNVLPAVKRLFDRRLKFDRWEVVLIIRYAMKTSRPMMQAVVDEGFIPFLIEWFGSSSPAVEKASGSTLGYFISHGIALHGALLSRHGLLPTLAHKLIFSENNHSATLRTLLVLERVLVKLGSERQFDFAWEALTQLEAIQQLAVLRKRYSRWRGPIGKRIERKTKALLKLYRNELAKHEDPEVLPDIDRFLEEIQSSKAATVQLYTRLLYNCARISFFLPVQRMIELRAVPILFKLIERFESSKELVHYAATIFAAMANGTSEQVNCITSSGVCSMLIGLLDSDHPATVQAALFTLNEIAGNKPENIDLLVSLKIVPALARVVQNADEDWPSKIFEYSSECVSKLVAPSEDAPAPREVLLECFPLILCYFVREASLPSQVHHADWAMAHVVEAFLDNALARDLSERDAEMVRRELTKPDILPVLVNKIRKGDDSYCLGPAFTTIRYLCQHEQQTLLNYGLLSAFAAQMSYRTEDVHAVQVIWSLQSIVDRSRSGIQAVIDANLVPFIIRALRTTRVSVHESASQLVMMITESATADQIKVFIKAGLMSLFVDILIYRPGDYAVQDALVALLDIANKSPIQPRIGSLFDPFTIFEVIQHLTIIQANTRSDSNRERATELIELLRHGSNISHYPPVDVPAPSTLLLNMSSENLTMALRSIRLLHNLLTRGAIPKELYQNSNIIDKITNVLKSDACDDEIRLQALTVLRNVVAYANETGICKDIELELYYSLRCHMSKASPHRSHVIDQSLYILSRIAELEPSFGRMILRLDAARVLTELADDPSIALRDETLSLISQLLSKFMPTEYHEVLEYLPLTGRLLVHGPAFGPIMLYACCTLAYIADTFHRDIDPDRRVTTRKAVKRLVYVLDRGLYSPEYLRPILSIFKYIALYRSRLFVECGGVACFRRLLKRTRQISTLMGIVEVISFVTLINSARVQSVLDGGVMPFIVEYMQSSDERLRDEAVEVFAGMIYTMTADQAVELLHFAVLQRMYETLADNEINDDIRSKLQTILRQIVYTTKSFKQTEMILRTYIPDEFAI